MEQTLLLNVKQVSELLGLSERTVWKMSSCGEIPPPIRIGRSVRWSRSTLEQFLSEREEAVKGEAARIERDA